MSTNILKAILNIKKRENYDLSEILVFPKKKLSSVNRANNMGEALEYFTKDAFCDTFNQTNAQNKKDEYSKKYSYLGNQNNPPDLIIKGSDAVEVKKIDGVKFSDLALNSSYPKSKLFANNPMITSICKNCESNWVEKDMLYVVGNIDDNSLKVLTLVYGDCYAASREIYERIKNSVSDGLKNLDLEFAETKELGRVNRVDPLGITNLRIRGMWTIRNPLKLYENLFEIKEKEFQLFALMRKDKFDSMPKEDRVSIENERNIEIENIKIQNPDNPAQQLDSKLIIYRK